MRRRITYHCGHSTAQLGVVRCRSISANAAPSIPIYCRISTASSITACYHEKRLKDLPTLDMWGRNKLQRRCSGCKRELHHSSIGDAPLFTVLLVGASSAGKTVFHRQAIRGLSALNAMPHTSARSIPASRKAN